MATKIAPIFGPPAGTVQWLRDCIERGKKQVFSEVVSLTPGLADVLLKANPDNRGLKHTKIAQYAADMRAGRWSFNGEPIIVSKDGMLNDGQNRCNAVIEANRPVPFLLVFGIDRETRTTVDQGAARSASDYAQMDGVQNAAVAATIARMVLAYEMSDGQGISDGKYVTNAAIKARLVDDAAIGEAAHFAVTTGRAAKHFAAGTVIGFCYYVFAKINKADADEFLTKLCFGEGLSRRDPAHTAREKLAIEGKSRERKAAIVFRAWNFHRRRAKVADRNLYATLPFPALV